MAICNAAIPRLANLFEEGLIGPFRLLLLQLCGVGALLGLLGVLFAVLIGEPLLYMMYGEAFSAQSGLLVGIMMVGGIWYTIAPLGSSLSAMRRFGTQAVIQAAAVGVSTLACLTLVTRIGVDGAVVGWGMGLVCQALVSLGLVALYLRRWAEKTASRLVFDVATAGTRRRFD
jgi:O-antigen/teichoic acid export membrane protein